MLSDATTMQGGETALACANGNIKKVRGPQMGWAIMLQGRYIDHVALSAFGAPERVTMVISIAFISNATNTLGRSHPTGRKIQW